MVRFFEDSVSFAYSWAQTSLAFFTRYPNPYSAHVLAGDVLDQHVCNGKLYTTRLLLKTGATPRWVRRWVKGSEGWILEETVVDPLRSTMVAKVRNLSYPRIMVVRELLTLKADGPLATTMHVEAVVESNMPAVRKRIENFAYNRYAENSVKSRNGILHTLQRMANCIE